jgi:ribosomal protein S27E
VAYSSTAIKETAFSQGGTMTKCNHCGLIIEDYNLYNHYQIGDKVYCKSCGNDIVKEIRIQRIRNDEE